MDLGEKGNVSARLMRLDRGAHPRETGADDQDVVLGFH
jgi:hypothetical protein